MYIYKSVCGIRATTWKCDAIVNGKYTQETHKFLICLRMMNVINELWILCLNIEHKWTVLGAAMSSIRGHLWNICVLFAALHTLCATYLFTCILIWCILLVDGVKRWMNDVLTSHCAKFVMCCCCCFFLHCKAELFHCTLLNRMLNVKSRLFCEIFQLGAVRFFAALNLS